MASVTTTASLLRAPRAPVRALHIGGASLRAALILGARAVVAQRDHLNEINVFPVADGDTGTNMAFTFAALSDAVRGLRGANVAEVANAAALAAVDGARGNSGAIVAQFFYCFAQALEQRARVSLAELSAAVSAASLGARRALAEPKEGTILSVMHAFAAGMAACKAPLALAKVFESGLRAAERALQRTTQQLAVLAAHQVQDAGASGFVSFLKSVSRLIALGWRKARAASTAEPASELAINVQQPGHFSPLAETMHHAGDSSFRYCSECLLENADVTALRSALGELALDSMVLAGGAVRAHLHAHTDHPAQLFELAARFGRVSQRKADDMHAQVRARSNPAKVAIVCDSAADLPEAEIRRLFLHCVPVRVNFGSEEFIDRITLGTAKFYQRLRTDPHPVRTSQPPSGEFRRLFSQLASQHEALVCCTLSAKLSGTFQGAMAAARLGGFANAHVLDTENAAAGEALVVLDAAEAAQAGCAAEEIVQRIQLMRARTVTYALIRDASFVARGGRLPKWVAALTRWLGVALLVSSRAGKIVPSGVLLGSQNLPERFARWVLARTPRDAPLMMIAGHCDCAAQGAQLAHALRQQSTHQLQRLHEVEAGVGIGAHAGPGTLVLGVQRVVPLP